MAIYTRFPPKAPEAPESDLAPQQEQSPAQTATARTDRKSRAAGATDAAAVAEPRISRMVSILMFSLILPIIFHFGPLRMSPNRLILVIMIVPLLFKWLSGAAGRIRTADILVVLTSLWMALTFVIDRGSAVIQYAGITGIEMLGPYLMARCYIRTEAQYLALIRTFRWIALILVPIAAIEATTQIRLLNMLFEPLFATFPTRLDPRWGMQRTQTGFEHPILYGCFVAFLFSPIYFSLRQRLTAGKSFLMASPVPAATFFALSSGAYLGLIVQLLLIAWGFVTRHLPNRWIVLTVLTVLAFIVVDLISNRTPFEVFISYLTFNSSTSYWRVLIFVYGIQNVWANPLFGLGLSDWVRPAFMHTASVDNLWLVMAMRHGIPGFLLFAGIYAAVITALVRARPALASVRDHRLGLMFSFIGLAIAVSTVHVWSASFVFFMFMLGAGAWISDTPREGDDTAQPSDQTGVNPPPASRATSPIRSGQTRSAASQRTTARAGS